jgi:hypothetical protein
MTTNTTQKAAGAINTNGLHTDTNDLDFTGERPSKAIATQVAQLAIAGHVVHKGQSGDYLVCKYGMSRYCQDFAELQAFALQLGVTQ